jgi:hypothetical protein
MLSSFHPSYVNQVESIPLCVRKIRRGELHPPFQQILLKTCGGSSLSFPVLPLENTKILELEDFLEECSLAIEYSGTHMSFRGFFQGIAFLEIDTDTDADNRDDWGPSMNECLRDKDEFWWALIDELVTTQHVCGMPINEQVTNLFETHVDLLCFLRDGANQGYEWEIPVVAYAEVPWDRREFTMAFGISALPAHEAVDQCSFFFRLEPPSEPSKDNVVARFALFLKGKENNGNQKKYVCVNEDTIAVRTFAQQVPLNYF